MPLYFLGGVHGAGKTVLSQSLAPRIGAAALSASKLISEEGAEPSTPDKRVADIDGNQERLLTALAKYRATLNTILLDGHYCLRNESGKPEPVPVTVFRRLGATAFLLLSEDPEQITARLSARDSRQHELESIVGLMACEQNTAKRLSTRLRVPLKLLRGPTAVEDAVMFINSLSN